MAGLAAVERPGVELQLRLVACPTNSGDAAGNGMFRISRRHRVTGPRERRGGESRGGSHAAGGRARDGSATSSTYNARYNSRRNIKRNTVFVITTGRRAVTESVEQELDPWNPYPLV